jgi:hypothetical protein
MKHKIIRIKLIKLSLLLIIFGFSSAVYPQYAVKWMSAGSLHNWYSEIGSEIEEGFVKEQQYGLQWPAINSRQDIQAAKGLWIGVTNFTDPLGDNYPHKVVHVGPRVTGAGEFFPQEFKMTSKFEPPLVFVDNDVSVDKSVDNDFVDPDLFADRLIVNKVNTQTGISMTRRIFQFSQQYHDNYIISEYTFKNTGNTDGDADIELPTTTLTGVYFYYQFRLAVCANVRNVIGNSTSWGINTMNDARGDGQVDPDNPDNLRFQYIWHGRLPAFTRYDNIGGPIWSSALWVDPGDTVGRLGASQFAGVITLHADVSADDKNDDPLQPKTTSYEGSDEPNTSNNDAYNKARMTSEYSWITRGHKSPRHAIKVEPTGFPGFISPTGDPALGTPGGFSFTNGYGPYILAPGDSITLVFAEGVAGISRELATSTGIKYKNKQISKEEKNTVVFQSRDSLFQTFRRANANYLSGYNIPRPPLPPKIFNVTGGGDKISLSWETYDDPGANLEGFEVYRAVGKPDSTYYLLHTAGVTERSFDDVTAVRGLSYYYYIVSVGSEASNTGVGLTPPGKLKSSRYYTQTYNPAILKRQAGTDMDDIRVVPNPYNISAATDLGFGELAQNRLYFFNIPGRCDIKIYSELGELVETIEHTDGSGDQAWDSRTSSGQIVVSGIYIAVIENKDTGESKIVKFVIIR